MAALSITLKKSYIGKPMTQRRVAWGLGLTRLNKTVVRNDTREIRGMIYKIRHLVEVVESI